MCIINSHRITISDSNSEKLLKCLKKEIKNNLLSQVLWYVFIIPTLVRLRLGHHEFKISVENGVRLCSKIPNQA